MMSKSSFAILPLYIHELTPSITMSNICDLSWMTPERFPALSRIEANFLNPTSSLDWTNFKADNIYIVSKFANNKVFLPKSPNLHVNINSLHLNVPNIGRELPRIKHLTKWFLVLTPASEMGPETFLAEKTSKYSPLKSETLETMSLHSDVGELPFFFGMFSVLRRFCLNCAKDMPVSDPSIYPPFSIPISPTIFTMDLNGVNFPRVEEIETL